MTKIQQLTAQLGEWPYKAYFGSLPNVLIRMGGWDSCQVTFSSEGDYYDIAEAIQFFTTLTNNLKAIEQEYNDNWGQLNETTTTNVSSETAASDAADGES